jgi:hypothetical protein
MEYTYESEEESCSESCESDDVIITNNFASNITDQVFPAMSFRQTYHNSLSEFLTDRLREPVEEDFHLCFNMDRSSQKFLGSLTMTTLKKLQRKGLITYSVLTNRIFRKIFEIYFIHIHELKDNLGSIKSYKQATKFISCLPSLKQIEKFVRQNRKNKRNWLFVKFCLDAYEDYYKNYDYPLYEKYTKAFLKTSIDFYEKVSKESMDYINSHIKVHLMKFLSIFI